MNNETKKDYLLIGCSFAAGMVIMGAASLFCGCPSPKMADIRPMPKAEQLPPPPAPDFVRSHENRQGGRDREFDRPQPFEGEHQGQHPMGMFQPKDAPNNLDKVLRLSDEQKAQLEKFRQQDMAEFKVIKDKMKELRLQADQIRERGKNNFESILTDEQKTTLKQMHEHFAASGPKDRVAPRHLEKGHLRMMPKNQNNSRQVPAPVPAPLVQEETLAK